MVYSGLEIQESVFEI